MANKWNNEYRPKTISHPGETLLDLLEEKGMSQVQLAERSGRPKKTINEIIKGKVGITAETAIQLERVLGAPANFWITRQAQYDEAMARLNARKKLSSQLEWLDRIPVKEMVKAGWISNYKDSTDTLNAVLTFFGINTPDQWERVWLNPIGAYRQSAVFKKSPEANSVWLRKGEIEAEKIICQKYNMASFRQTLQTIKTFTLRTPEEFESQVVEICANAGVAVVFVPPIKGVPVYGVTRWVSPEKALIQLSLRGKYEDIFWFTFFHEAGHILKHGKKEVFVESKGFTSEKETEADKFAANFLVPLSKWKQFVNSGDYHKKESVQAFAKGLGLSPAIVVGRLHHEGILAHSHMNDLRRRFGFKKGE